METITVVLDKPHTHQGILHQAGDEIAVSKAEADFLLNQQVIKKIPAKASLKKAEDK